DDARAATGRVPGEGGALLMVHGSATTEGGDLHVSGVALGYGTQSTETVLTALEGLSGSFDTLSHASSLLLEAELAYDYDNYQVNLEIELLVVAAAAKRLASGTPAGMPAAHGFQRAVDRIERSVHVDEALLALAGECQALSDERQASAALDSLSGESHALATTLGFDAIDMGRRALSARIGQLKPGDPAGAWRQALGAGD